MRAATSAARRPEMTATMRNERASAVRTSTAPSTGWASSGTGTISESDPSKSSRMPASARRAETSDGVGVIARQPTCAAPQPPLYTRRRATDRAPDRPPAARRVPERPGHADLRLADGAPPGVPAAPRRHHRSNVVGTDPSADRRSDVPRRAARPGPAPRRRRLRSDDAPAGGPDHRRAEETGGVAADVRRHPG